MRTGLFDNTKNALVFGGCVLVAAIVLVGEEGEDAAVAVSSGPSSREASYIPPGASKQVAAEQPEIGDLSGFYGSGEDSVEEPDGSDPSPTSEPSSSEAPSSEGSSIGGPRPAGIDGPGT